MLFCQGFRDWTLNPFYMLQAYWLEIDNYKHTQFWESVLPQTWFSNSTAQNGKQKRKEEWRVKIV